MKLPIDGIQAFVLIAELGSFQRAAEQLALTQTALTRRIQRLESFVGARFLDRTTRTTALTPMGREFLPLAQRIIRDLTGGLERLRTVAHLALGDVTLAALSSVAFRQLPAILRSYARKYPANRVRLLERSGVLVTEAVRQGEADFGIHVHQEDQPDLIEDLLVRSPFMLVCHHRHPLAGAGEVCWRDLKGVDLVTLGGTSGNRHLVEMQLERAGLPAQGRFVVENTPSALALCAAGVGAAILPAASPDAGGLVGGLVQLRLVDPLVHRSISLVRRRGETLTPAAAALYALVRRRLAAPPAPQVVRQQEKSSFS